MIKLFNPLSPSQVELIVKQIKKNPLLLIYHEINMRGVQSRKIYDISWSGIGYRRRKECFYFPLTSATFQDNIHLLTTIDNTCIDEAIAGFIKNGWVIYTKSIKHATCTFLQKNEKMDEYEPTRKKDDFLYPLTPLEMEEAAEVLCNDQKSLIILDMNWELINLSLLHNKINGTITPSIKKMHQAGKIQCDFHVIDVVLKTYEKHGWRISEDDHMRYFIDKRQVKKFVQVC